MREDTGGHREEPENRISSVFWIRNRVYSDLYCTLFSLFVSFCFCEGGADHRFSDPACQKIKKKKKKSSLSCHTTCSVFTPVCNFDHYSIRKNLSDKKVILFDILRFHKYGIWWKTLAPTGSQMKPADLFFSMHTFMLLCFQQGPTPEESPSHSLSSRWDRVCGGGGGGCSGGAARTNQIQIPLTY